DAHSEDWIAGQGAELFKQFNANPENKDYKKVTTWAELAAIKTTGTYDLYQLLTHSINAAYDYMQIFEKLPPEDEDYEKVRELLEATLNDGYIILRSIEIESAKIEEKAVEAKVQMPELSDIEYSLIGQSV
ncbi:MAG: hypothetical protein KAR20_01670, partial [Candidatus Heimdallarchaeota archaeon]|nr:hypothetical protein [Candidatus Heimdallarchaeota archaeon]